MAPAARPPARYPPSYKARIVAEYEGLDKRGKGALLRREGLYSSLLCQWRKQARQGALGVPGPGGGDRRNALIASLRTRAAELEAELQTARRVIELQGKLSELLLAQLAAGSDSTCASDAAPPGAAVCLSSDRRSRRRRPFVADEGGASTRAAAIARQAPVDGS